jgi:hypothetical protein
MSANGDVDALASGVAAVAIDTAKLNPLSPEVISRQATINIGTIGHVAHGKSTVVKAISGVQTVRFKTELVRNITIKLGYANAKVRSSCGHCGMAGAVQRVPRGYIDGPLPARRGGMGIGGTCRPAAHWKHSCLLATEPFSLCHYTMLQDGRLTCSTFALFRSSSARARRASGLAATAHIPRTRRMSRRARCRGAERR